MKADRNSELHDWHFTLLLLAAYVALFHAWGFLDRFWVAVTGVVASSVLVLTLLVRGRRRYFVNSWDQLFHALVILDLLLEALLVGPPEGLGFYGCAAGFGLVLGYYRVTMLKRTRLPAAL